MAGTTILVIDDSAVQLELTRLILAKEGFTVLTAGTAEEALDIVAAQKPQLILADIELPGMDGLAFTRLVKSQPETRSIPVWAVTSLSGPEDETRSRAAGCDDYLRKPIEADELARRVRTCLGNGGHTSVRAERPSGWDIPAKEMEQLRARFRGEAKEQVRRWLDELSGPFQPREASQAVHQWIGTASMLGFQRVSELALEMQSILHERPLDQTQLRDTLLELSAEFAEPREQTNHG